MGLILLMVIDALRRRSFLAAAAGFALPFTTHSRTLEKNLFLYISSLKKTDGNHLAVVIDASGTIQFQENLPDRGHDIAIDPARKTAVIFARRPGRFAMVLDLKQQQQDFAFETPNNRHFYGHGFFSADGRLLFASENDFEKGRGVIGIYSVQNKYHRIGEFETKGIGPHQILLKSDENTIVVANGGIATHPDYLGRKLNLASMQSSISYLDINSGDLIDQVLLPKSLHKLSIRHIAEAADGAIWFGGQYEGYAKDNVPLVGRHMLCEKIEFLQTETLSSYELKQYVGSVSANNDGSFMATSCPRAGLLLIWDTKKMVLDTKRYIPDVCGVAPYKRDFFSSDGFGNLWQGNDVVLKFTESKWDNHIRNIYY